MSYHDANRNHDGAGVTNDLSSLIEAAELAFQTEGPLMSRQDLLTTVGAIKNLLAEVYRHLNSRASVSELPQELLALVFNEVIVAHKPDTPISFPALSSDGNWPILWALKVISQVCHLWRDVAFSTAALWTHVDSRYYPGDELYNVLQRSYALPISLFLHKASYIEDSGETGNTQVHSSLLQRMSSRLRRVDLDVQEPKPPIIEELLSFDGSTVYCLTISSTFNEVMDGALDSLTHVVPILQGQTDSLEALAIVPSIGWIPGNHFPSLTHLFISFLSGYIQSPDPQDILFLLHNTPRLQFLHLHHLASRDSPPTNEPWQPGSSWQPIELQSLRSLVFAYCSYQPAVDVLHELSLPPSSFVRLDDIYIPYNGYPDILPSGIGPLKHVDAMEIAVTENSFFLVAECASSGFWLKMRTFEDIDLDIWVLLLHISVPFGNLATLRIDARYVHVFNVLQHAVRLSDLLVVLSPGWEDGPGFERRLPPLVRALSSTLSRSQPVICPSLRSLTLQWPKGMSSFEDLGVPDVTSMLSLRAALGHPVARLVVQASSIHIHSESVQPSFFAAQLAQLAEYVEEYEECVDWEVNVCSSELRDMWNVEGAEDYWTLDEMQRARSMPLGRPPPRAFQSWR